MGGVIHIDYEDRDWQRLEAEPAKTSMRKASARDRGRLLHSASMRRLAYTTQVYSPLLPGRVRNRLTHSLEVAQIGRELAQNLGCDPEVVETACLAHDIGHPPFGHNGETVLNAWARGIGGFEGNAQTFRILTRLEPKVLSPRRSCGLNLTRASLQASCKYPWSRGLGPRGIALTKFGFYADDLEAFEWAFRGLPRRKCFESQIMDQADDIAYSVHDFEDSLTAGHIEVGELPRDLSSPKLLGEVLGLLPDGLFDPAELEAALAGLVDLWRPLGPCADRASAARLKNLTSELVGRFVEGVIRATRAEYAANSAYGRFDIGLVVPRPVQLEVALLKGVIAYLVMRSDSRKDYYLSQRRALGILVERLWSLNEGGLDYFNPVFVSDWRQAKNGSERRRVLLDQIASWSDIEAVEVMRELRQDLSGINRDVLDGFLALYGAEVGGV